MDQQFTKWDKYLDTIYKEVQELVANQHTFLKVWSMVDRNPKIQKPNSFYKFLYDTYAAYSTSAVRRQIKPEKNRKRKYNISFVELLEEIIETPDVLSRERFAVLYQPIEQDFGPVDIEQVVNHAYQQFAAVDADHFDPNIVQQDLKELKEHGDKIEQYADRRIAHRDKRPSRIPTFGEIDACIDCLKKLTIKYRLLFRAEDLSNCFVPQQLATDYWKEIFSQPWILRDEPDQLV